MVRLLYDEIAPRDASRRGVTVPLVDRGGAMLNVAALGARGDGVSDDTAAIQAGIDELESQGGGQLFIPRGVHITTGLTGASRVDIVGAGHASEIRLADGLSSARPLFYAHGCTDFSLSRLRLNANRHGIASGALRNAGQPWECVSIAECKSVLIERTWIADADNEGIDIDGGSDIEIANTLITGCGGSAIHPSHGTGSLINYGVRMRGIVTRDNGHAYDRPAIYALDSEFFLIDFLRSHGDYFAVGVGGARLVKGVIRDVESHEAHTHAVRIYAGALQVDIDGLFALRPNGSGLYVDGAGDDRKSRWKNIRVVEPTGVGIRTAGRNWTLVDPEVTNPGGSGITTVTGGDGEIVRPFLVGADRTDDGILVAAAGTKVVSPTIRGFANGIRTTSVANVETIGGRLSGNDIGYNMSGEAASQHHRIIGVDVTGNSVQGLRRVGKDHRVVGCQGAASAGNPEEHGGWHALAIGADVSSGQPMDRYYTTFPKAWVADRDCYITQIFVTGSEPRTEGIVSVQVEIDGSVHAGVSAQLTVTNPQARRSEVSIPVAQGQRVTLRYQTSVDLAPAGAIDILAGFVVE